MMSAKSVIAVSGISGNVTVAFVALSYAGGLNVTVVADPQRCPDLHDVAAAGGSSPEPVVIVRMVALGAGRSLADRRGLPGRHRHGPSSRSPAPGLTTTTTGTGHSRSTSRLVEPNTTRAGALRPRDPSTTSRASAAAARSVRVGLPRTT